MNVKRAVLSLIALMGLAGAGPARAEMPPDQLPFPPPPPSSTALLAHTLATLMIPVPGQDAGGGDFRVRVTLERPPAGTQPDRLLTHLRDAVEAAVRERVSLGARLDGETARPRHSFEVDLVVERGHLSATARWRQLPEDVWGFLQMPEGRVNATSFGAVPIDVELRTLLGLGRRQVRFDKMRMYSVTRSSDAAYTDARVLDMRVADLDADGRVELIILHPTKVLVAAWARGGFGGALAADNLLRVPPNPERLREPLGRLVVVVRPDGTRLLVAASSDRARALAWRFERTGDGGVLYDVPISEAIGWPLYATRPDTVVSVGWPKGRDVLEGAAREVRLDGGAATVVDRVDGLYDVRARGMLSATSPPWDPWLLTAEEGGRLHLWSASSRDQPIAIARRGAVAEIFDVDSDGSAEVLTTDASLDGSDRLALYRVQRGGSRPKRVWSSRTRAPVTALAAGDVDRDGYDEFIVATWHGRRGGLAVLAPHVELAPEGR